jgi:hypothetical protein
MTPHLIGLVLLLACSVALLAVFRWRAAVRGRQLAAQFAAEGASWATLCRVVAGGSFLDGGRVRRGGGPRGVLVVHENLLEYRPDPGEARRGDASFSWPLRDVHCAHQRRRRDISGVSMQKVQLELPEGAVSLALFHQVGTAPSFLRDQGG